MHDRPDPDAPLSELSPEQHRETTDIESLKREHDAWTVRLQEARLVRRMVFAGVAAALISSLIIEAIKLLLAILGRHLRWE